MNVVRTRGVEFRHSAGRLWPRLMPMVRCLRSRCKRGDEAPRARALRDCRTECPRDAPPFRRSAPYQVPPARISDSDVTAGTPHPGEIIKTLCLEPLGVTATQAAEALGVSRKTLSAILNGRAGVSPEMAVRLSIAFGTSSESWLNQQTQYDLWHAEQRRKRLRVVKLAPV